MVLRFYNNMNTYTQGIHHITAIASDARKNFEFYTNILGLRLVKKTVNQDDVQTYHLFFGDKEGYPGMDLTFFIFLPPSQGKRGNGLVTKISLAVKENALNFWLDRFNNLNVKNNGITEEFGKKRIVFFDEDDQKLEIVAVTKDEIDDTADVWTTDQISQEHAIRSFYSATLNTSHKQLVEPILIHIFGYEFVKTENNKHLYQITNSKRAKYLEIQEDPTSSFGINAAGTVHHIAFRAKDEEQQLIFKQKLDLLGVHHTTVINRFYFKSIYFRIPAGILFEIATDGPGFTADEKDSELGTHLALPPFLEKDRAAIEAQLIPLPTE